MVVSRPTVVRGSDADGNQLLLCHAVPEFANQQQAERVCSPVLTLGRKTGRESLLRPCRPLHLPLSDKAALLDSFRAIVSAPGPIDHRLELARRIRSAFGPSKHLGRSSSEPLTTALDGLSAALLARATFRSSGRRDASSKLRNAYDPERVVLGENFTLCATAVASRAVRRHLPCDCVQPGWLSVHPSNSTCVLHPKMKRHCVQLAAQPRLCGAACASDSAHDGN